MYFLSSLRATAQVVPISLAHPLYPENILTTLIKLDALDGASDVISF